MQRNKNYDFDDRFIELVLFEELKVNDLDELSTYLWQCRDVEKYDLYDWSIELVLYG